MSNQSRNASYWRQASTLAWASLATLMCMAGSSAYAFFYYLGDVEISMDKAVIASLVLPVFAGAPIYYLLFRRIRLLTFRTLRLEAKNRRDGMTKCLNKTTFHREVTQFLTGETGPIESAALLIVDADNFKRINDTYGHDAGDEAIRLIASKLRAVIRRRDPIGRIGGEEFAVLLHDADIKIAHAVAERIRSAVNLSDVPGIAPGAHLSVSVGGIVFENDVTFSEIFKAADTRLYSAKSEGRNCVDVGIFDATQRRAA